MKSAANDGRNEMMSSLEHASWVDALVAEQPVHPENFRTKHRQKNLQPLSLNGSRAQTPPPGFEKKPRAKREAPQALPYKHRQVVVKQDKVVDKLEVLPPAPVLGEFRKQLERNQMFQYTRSVLGKRKLPQLQRDICKKDSDAVIGLGAFLASCMKAYKGSLEGEKQALAVQGLQVLFKLCVDTVNNDKTENKGGLQALLSIIKAIHSHDPRVTRSYFINKQGSLTDGDDRIMLCIDDLKELYSSPEMVMGRLERLGILKAPVRSSNPKRDAEALVSDKTQMFHDGILRGDAEALHGFYDYIQSLIAINKKTGAKGIPGAAYKSVRSKTKPKQWPVFVDSSDLKHAISTCLLLINNAESPKIAHYNLLGHIMAIHAFDPKIINQHFNLIPQAKRSDHDQYIYDFINALESVFQENTQNASFEMISKRVYEALNHKNYILLEQVVYWIARALVDKRAKSNQRLVKRLLGIAKVVSNYTSKEVHLNMMAIGVHVKSFLGKLSKEQGQLFKILESPLSPRHK